MYKKYEHLLSPLKVGNTIFRNRLFSAPQGLHALQAGEPYPNEAIMTTFANKARGGAAMVTLHFGNPGPDGAHPGTIAYDLYSVSSRHYIAQLAEIVHFFGAKASMEIMGGASRSGYDVCAGMIDWGGNVSKEITKEIMDETAETYASQAKEIRDLGYDMVMIHMGYGMSLGARFLSPATNKRTDKYGGSVENRARFPIMIFDRIKQKCGKDFLIELRMSGAEPITGGMKIEDSIKLAKIFEGHIDLLQVHAGDTLAAHPLSFLPPAPNLAFAEAIKKSGTNLAIVTIGGYQDPEESEKIIAEGKADFISMARGWIADPNLGTKIYEGRGEDIVPCIKCMRCHDSACVENRTYVCSVNPVIGLEHKLEKIVKPAETKKKVAVVGGGPAGMEAALIAAGRGHRVTLYEKTSSLGGQLNFSDYVAFKYSLNKFKKFLINQVEKSNINICLNTEATAELLRKERFDVIIGALGAETIVPPIPGIENKNVILAPDVYGKEKTLNEPVIVIGGGQVGCETALHLAMLKHEVTLLELQDKLAPDASPTYRSALLKQMSSFKNLHCILSGCCVSIGNEVNYTDVSGLKQNLKAGTVVIAVGMRPRRDEAMSFYNTASRFIMIGDCESPGNVEKTMRSAFSSSIVL